MKIIKIISILTLGIFINGCWNLGEPEGICASKGCSYAEAGVCGNSFDIYKNWQVAEKKAYVGPKYQKCQQCFNGLSNKTNTITIIEEQK